jgi:Family of unknown function (DUF6714)
MITNPELSAHILSAFPALPLGKSVKDLRRLVEIGAKDASALDHVNTWRDMVPVLAADTLIDALPVKLMFLEGATWRAFLPAWMTASLDADLGTAEQDNFVAATVCSLDPQVTAEMSSPDIFRERTAELTAAQGEAIAGFVVWAGRVPVMRGDSKAKPQIARLLSTWPPPSSVAPRSTV